MFFKNKKKLITAAACCLMLIPLSACNKNSNTKPNKINVVSSVNFYGDVAKQVGGKHVKVASIINSNVDPHDFEPTINDAKKVDKADVVIANGICYDDWMTNLIKNSNDKKQTDIDVGTLMHKKNGDNEHIWYDPQTMDKLANKLAAVYSKKRPQDKKLYYHNANFYRQKWSKTTALIKQIKKYSHGKYVAVSEPVFDYSLISMGYKISDNGFANAIEKGVDPSATDITHLQSYITHHKIAFFVNNIQASDPVVAGMVDLAKKNHVPIVNVSETKPPHKNYIQWMTGQYRQVLHAQKQ